MESSIFAGDLKHYGKTKEEQIEKNKPAMAWLKQQIEEEISEEEAKKRSEYLHILKQTLDEARPAGAKLYFTEN